MNSTSRPDWHRCYGESWTGIIVPESFCHPAKFSRALIRRIYQHAFEEGWLEAGQVVLDPFGGVALGALEAMRRGLAWIGVELEEKFVDLGQQNIDLWNETYGPHLPGWGSAVLLQGDSRNLARVVAEAGAVVSSPPFQGTGVGGSSNVVNLNRQCVSKGRPQGVGQGQEAGNLSYGSHSGQLAALPEGDLAAATAAVISSPPFQQVNAAEGRRGRNMQRPSQKWIEDHTGHQVHRDYGSHPAQLGQMRDGGFDAAVSSPPFSQPETRDRSPVQEGSVSDFIQRAYTVDRQGTSEGNIAQESGDTFWSASRLIVEQVYQVLRPGGVAIFVTKSFVRKGKRVDFPGQWRDLCEACGFVTLHQHRAWLVEDRGAQYDLMGELHERKVERKSFFRRLAEKKGSPSIDYEVVLAMRKESEQ